MNKLNNTAETLDMNETMRFRIIKKVPTLLVNKIKKRQMIQQKIK